MRKIKKSTGITVALLVYVTVCAVYLLPRNNVISTSEKCWTLAASYVIVLVLWLVLRKKEQLQKRRREEEDSNQIKK